jgi:hypothetical protein
MFAYLVRHGELPPLNYKFNWSVFDEYGWKFVDNSDVLDSARVTSSRARTDGADETHDAKRVLARQSNLASSRSCVRSCSDTGGPQW